jgi:predicted house-cleaning NTP pyrophosphatase (Maf/HAM1 superfamily)
VSSADLSPDPVRQAIVLASESAARRRMLEQAGFSVTVIPSGAPEDENRSTPGETVEHLARIKMKAVLSGGRIPAACSSSPVVTADTLVTSGTSTLYNLTLRILNDICYNLSHHNDGSK